MFTAEMPDPDGFEPDKALRALEFTGQDACLIIWRFESVHTFLIVWC